MRTTEHGGWPALNRYLSEWEGWVAELMETHLAYPVLAYFRSQHVNQNWLSAMCAILDACTFTIAAAPADTADAARFTFAIARHAVADLSYSFHVTPQAPEVDRLPLADLTAAAGQPRRERRAAGRRRGHDHASGWPACAPSTNPRSTRSPSAWTSRCPLGSPTDSPTDNWRTTQWH